MTALRPVVVVESAELATPELVGALVRCSSGFLKVTRPEVDADRLHLPPMGRMGGSVAGDHGARQDAAAVDAREGVTTGISATDRTRTIALLAAETAQAGDFADRHALGMITIGDLVEIRYRS